MDPATVEALLGVRPPLRPADPDSLCEQAGEHQWTSGLAEKEILIQRLQQVIRGDEARWEVQRRACGLHPRPAAAGADR